MVAAERAGEEVDIGAGFKICSVLNRRRVHLHLHECGFQARGAG